ncbi:MAG: DNA polymerase IV [Acidimicrobiia bacterium]
MPGSRDDASVLHVDLDAFYASVEQLDDPTLRGQPVIVGGTGNRGVVCAASYEARTFGVHSAMPTWRARRACPDGVFLSPRFDRYSEKSHDVMAILTHVTPLVEQLSIDEAFVDVAGVRRRHGSGRDVAMLLRAQIRAETGLTASIGAATTKFLAKLASDLSKPDGLLVIEPGTELAFLEPLPVTRLWGVGPATFKKLDRMGIRTIGDVANVDQDVLVGALGQSLGHHLRALAHNDDERAVVPDRGVKSIGAEETFDRDLHTRAECERELSRLADRAAIRMRRGGLVARTVTMKIRFGDFETRTRSRTLPAATDHTALVVATARALLDGFELERGVRLLGVSLSQLSAEIASQQILALDEDVEAANEHDDRLARIERAADAVRERFGDQAVRPATLIDGGDQS